MDKEEGQKVETKEMRERKKKEADGTFTLSLSFLYDSSITSRTHREEETRGGDFRKPRTENYIEIDGRDYGHGKRKEMGDEDVENR